MAPAPDDLEDTMYEDDVIELEISDDEDRGGSNYED